MNSVGAFIIVVVFGTFGYAVYADSKKPPYTYPPHDITKKYNLPESLKDCTVTEIDGENVNTLRVVRCPNSTTSATYIASKSTRTVVTMDGK